MGSATTGPRGEVSWKRWNGDGATRYVEIEPWEWVGLGVAPRPRGPLRVFVYHLGHGLVMGYPLHDILVFAWRNRKTSFGETWVNAQRERYYED